MKSFFNKRSMQVETSPQDLESAAPTSIGGGMQIFEEPLFTNSVRQGGRLLWLSAVAIGLGIVFAGSGAYYVLMNNADRFSETPHVYFEVKAIDPEGHSVASAEVKLGGRKLGVTDSFGEWRQFLQLKLGSSTRVSIRKETSSGVLSAEKNVVVPLRRQLGSEIEIRHVLQLGLKPQKEDKVSSSSPPAEAPSTSAQLMVRTDTEAQLSTGADHQFNRMHLTMDADLSKDPRFAKLVSVLRAKFNASGISMEQESPWQVRLSRLNGNQGSDLFKVEVSLAGSDEKASFLRNLITDQNVLASQIYDLVKFHTPRRYQLMREQGKWYALQPEVATNFWRLSAEDKLIGPDGSLLKLQPAAAFAHIERMQVLTDSDPCTGYVDETGRCMLQKAGIKIVPPRSDLESRRIQYLGAGDAAVYALGFQARALGKGVYEYWGRKGAKSVNVTVVTGNVVKLRAAVEQSGNKMAILAKPARTVARR